MQSSVVHAFALNWDVYPPDGNSDRDGDVQTQPAERDIKPAQPDGPVSNTTEWLTAR
jgi:hypothetical protein